MIKSGSTAWQIIKPGVDLGLIDSIIITYKTLPGYGSRVLLQKRYPDDTRVNGDELLLPLSQADTTLLREEGGDRVRLELQYNFTSGAVAKSEIQTVHIGDTLATAYVDGSNPDEAQIEGLPIEFAAGDAIVIESKNKCVKDWNENDPESPKYIEGRTHYKKPTYPSDAPMIETLTAGATLLYDFTGLSATYINRLRYENATDPDGRYPFEWSWEAKLSTGWMASENTSAGNYYAEKIDDANFRIMGNKKYDFYLYFISDPALLTPEYANRFPKKGVYVTVNDSGTANIRNFKAGFVAVAQLKRNYIPDSIARTDDVVSRQQFAADAGKALVIGEDGVVKAGEVGGGGSLIVTITENDDGTYTPSHTSQEIYAAYMGGKSVTAAIEGDILPLTICDGPKFAGFTLSFVNDDGSQGYIAFDIEGDKAECYSDFYTPAPMTPASATEDGTSGLVPAPAAGQQDMVLHGDGTWRDPNGYDVFYRYTAEEDLTEGFEITAIDGETIAYKEIFVRLRLVNKTDAKVTPYVKILTDWSGNQDFQPRWNWSSVDPNSEIVICAEAKLLGNGVGYCDWYWYTHAQVYYQNGGNYRRVQNPSHKINANEQSMFDFIKYNVIKGVWCNTTLSAGTDIEIWGKKL